MPNKETLINSLAEIGLGENEAILYEMLLNNPDTTIPFLQKKSQFSRTMLYYILQNLESMELVETKKLDKKTVYNAVSPNKLEELMKEREKEMDKQKKLLRDILIDLNSAYRLSHNKPGIKFFEGLDGIKEALDDSLNNNNDKQIRTFCDAVGYSTYLKEWNEKYYAPTRMKKGIFERVVIPDEAQALDYMSNHIANPSTDVLFVDHNKFSFQTEINIYDNKVSFVTFSEKNHIGVIVESKEIFNTLASVFDYMWEAGKKDFKQIQPPWIKRYKETPEEIIKDTPYKKTPSAE